MWLKRLAIALLAGVMLIMVLPVGATANNELYPTVDLWFTRNPNDSTKGTLYVSTTNGILGYSGIFAYQAGNSSSWKEVEIYPGVVVPVEISGLPTNSYYTITYYTYYFYPYLSPFKTFTISPQSGSSSGTHVSIISSSRSGSSVIVSLNVLEPCTFYYSDNSNMNNKSSCFLPEVRPIQLPLENYSSNVMYYYTERQVGGNTVKSDVKYFIVGTSGSGSTTSGYPVLTNCSFVLTSTNKGTFYCTSDRAGVIFYTVATSPPESSFYPTGSYNLQPGTNSFTIEDSKLSQSGAKVYYYTVGSNGSMSSRQSISVGTSTVISSVNVNTSKSPAAGEFPSSIAYSTSDNKFTVTGMEWYKYNASSNKTDKYEKMGIGEYFLPGNTYAVEFTVAPKSGYTFPSYPNQFTASVNGKSATLTDYSTSSAKFRYAFDKLPGLVEIKNVVVYGIDDPAAGKSPDTSGTPGDSSYYISSITWNPTTSQFKAGNTYTVQVTLMPASGYKFNVESAKIGYRNAKIESKSADRVVISYNYWVNPFTDVREYDVEPSASNPDGKPNRYYVFIKYCYLNKLFVGTSDTTFSPDATMTRAMFVTVLGRLAGVNVSAYKTDKFTDVKPDALYAPYVAWAVQNKIVVGKPENTFAPDDPVTREQVCELLRRYAVYAGINLKFTARSIGFPDANKVSDYAKAAVSIFEQAGVALPRPNSSNFFPQENAQRKEIAEMLILFMMQYLDD